MKKITLLLLLLSSILSVQGQIFSTPAVDSGRVGKADGTSKLAMYGTFTFHNIIPGLMRLNASRQLVTTTLTESDIPSLSISKVTGLGDSLDVKIPYTGAVSDVSLGNNTLTVGSGGTGAIGKIRVNGNYSTMNSHSIDDYSIITSSGADGLGYGIVDLSTVMVGTAANDHFIAYQARQNYMADGDMGFGLAGLFYSPAISGAGVVSYSRGVYLSEPAGSGTLLNNYGIWINDLTKGTDNNYAIYSGLGKVFHGDTVTTSKNFRAGTLGNVQLSPGDASRTGFVEFRKSNGTRVGYIGYAGSDSIINYNNELGGKHVFNGQIEGNVTGDLTGDASNALKFGGIPYVANTTITTPFFMMMYDANDASWRPAEKATIQSFLEISGGSTAPFVRTTANDTNYAFGSLPTANRVNLLAFTAMTGNRTVDIPAGNATNAATNLIIVKDESGSAVTHTITITPASGTIDGAATKVINAAYGVVELYSNGTNWFTK